jgi:hypothetical protein
MWLVEIILPLPLENATLPPDKIGKMIGKNLAIESLKVLPGR